ncbi:MAG: 4'-phosphopantetheinyl transferase superfamily protein [Nitrospirota bacterium]
MNYPGVKEMFGEDQAFLPIGRGEVHLWICNHEVQSSNEMHQRLWSLLSKTELQKYSRFYFAKDRSRYLLTRALIRTVLSRYANVNPCEWQFEKTPNGRPTVGGGKQQAISHLSFNISHTNGLIIVGVANAVAIGVDVENTNRVTMLEIADRVFSAEEVAKMRTLSKEEQVGRFFTLWTLKESYVKARGMGLRFPLKQIAFEIVGARIHPCFDRRVNDTEDRWKFWQLYPNDHHVVAICAGQPMTGKLQLTCRKAFPLCSEEVLDCVPIRESK